MMTTAQRIQNIGAREYEKADKILNRYRMGLIDAETVVDYVHASSLKEIWAIVFEKEDEDVQLDIFYEVRR